MKQKEQRNWWKEGVVYQVYPRSFKDSNGDGIGDLQGIIAGLDYIKSLGVDIIWLNPIYASPNADNGYDISNYREIMKEFGTLEDFDRLLQEVHARGLKLVLDLVVNHTSDEHPWFIEARKSRNNPYYAYYHWWPVEKESPPFRPGYFEPSAWSYNRTTRSWYLHYFSRKQPDLNWENPEVREEIYNLMGFWFEKGIDGFRMDSITLISKDTTFPPIDRKKHPDIFSYYAHGPHLHDYLHEMNRRVVSRYEVMTVGEGSALDDKDVAAFVDPDREELNMLYGFGPSDVRMYTRPDTPNSGIGYSLIALKKMFGRWDKAVGKGWPAVYLGNHDQPRMLSRFGNDAPEFRQYAAKMLATLLLTLRGTPYWFAGDEIGMKNADFNRIEDYRDIATWNQYREIERKGEDVKAFLEIQRHTSRDNARTPFQWNSTFQAGFTIGNPWIRVNTDYSEINVACQERDPWSVLNYFRRLVAFRKAHPEMVYGSYTVLDIENPQVYSYLRESPGHRFLVVLNFSPKPAAAWLDIDLSGAEIKFSNYESAGGKERIKSLRPFEALLITCS